MNYQHPTFSLFSSGSRLLKNDVLCLIIFNFPKNEMFFCHGATNPIVRLNLLSLFLFLAAHHCLPLTHPLCICRFAEIPRPVPWQQNDPHLTRLSGWELPHHHVHLLFSLQLQWRGDQINLNVRPTASRSHAKYHWQLHDKWIGR